MSVLFWSLLTLLLLGVVVFSSQLEILVPAAAAFVVLLVALVPGFGQDYLWQTVLWIVLSVAGMLAFRRKLRQLRLPKGGPVEEPVAGKTAVVVEALGEDTPGRVRFQGTTWAAESAYAIPVGTEVEVLSQKGLLLRVVPKKEVE